MAEEEKKDEKEKEDKTYLVYDIRQHEHSIENVDANGNKTKQVYYTYDVVDGRNKIVDTGLSQQKLAFYYQNQQTYRVTYNQDYSYLANSYMDSKTITDVSNNVTNNNDYSYSKEIQNRTQTNQQKIVYDENENVIKYKNSDGTWITTINENAKTSTKDDTGDFVYSKVFKNLPSVEIQNSDILKFPCDIGDGRDVPFTLLEVAEPDNSIDWAVFNDSLNDNNTRYKIILPLPDNGTQSSYSAIWQEESNAIGSIGSQINNVELNEGINRAAKHFVINFINNVLKDTGLANQFIELGQLSLKKSINDHKTMMFKNVNFRDFSLNYTLYPRNIIETQTIDNIIYKLKRSMHPSIESESLFSSTFLNYPDVARLTFFGPDMNCLFRTSVLAIQDISVTYGNGSGNPLFFASTKRPTTYNLSIKFKELELLHRKRIEQGF